MTGHKHISIAISVGLAVLLVAVGVIGTLFLTSFLKYDRYSKKDFIDRSLYQAIFLRNDQIYFGRLKNISSDFLLLKDVYYVKIDDKGEGKLVKLGKIEPHGPKDEMIINQDQVLFWENMRWDSLVVETIKNLQLKEK